MQANTTRTPTPSHLKIIYIIYALHIFSALNGLLSPALVITAFLTGWPSIIALLMSYIWRKDASDTYLYSHFNWLINTFWSALVWLAVAWLLIITVIGMVVGIPLMLVVGLWVLYRLGKGFFALNDRKPI
mgnify:CR=1 FL=1